jgi:hypothetical protein
MRFFLTDLGNQQLILGYPWFAAMQPQIDWARGWLEYAHLPVVLRTKENDNLSDTSGRLTTDNSFQTSGTS